MHLLHVVITRFPCVPTEQVFFGASRLEAVHNLLEDLQHNRAPAVVSTNQISFCYDDHYITTYRSPAGQLDGVRYQIGVQMLLRDLPELGTWSFTTHMIRDDVDLHQIIRTLQTQNRRDKANLPLLTPGARRFARSTITWRNGVISSLQFLLGCNPAGNLDWIIKE